MEVNLIGGPLTKWCCTWPIWLAQSVTACADKGKITGLLSMKANNFSEIEKKISPFCDHKMHLLMQWPAWLEERNPGQVRARLRANVLTVGQKKKKRKKKKNIQVVLLLADVCSCMKATKPNSPTASDFILKCPERLSTLTTSRGSSGGPGYLSSEQSRDPPLPRPLSSAHICRKRPFTWNSNLVV